MADINPPVDLILFAPILAANPQTTSDNWNLPAYGPVKDFIKEQYSILQEDICVYCKISVNFGGYGEPIEHIVPKSDRPQWMFEPRNLALSCYPCNTKKTAKNTLSAAGLASANYPTTATGFEIYHPHFNTWVNHFQPFHEFFLLPISPKGRRTFEVCELYRMDLPMNKAKHKGFREEPFRIKAIAKVLADPGASQEVKDQCQELSKKIIFRAKVRKGLQN